MVLRALARPLLASWFVYEAVDTILEPQKRAKLVAPTLEPALAEMGISDVDTADVVKVHAVATLGAATALAMSRNPRSSALLLAGLTAGTVALGAPFWTEQDPDRRREELERLLKNVSLLGGVLIAATAGHSARHVTRAKAKKAKARAAKKSKA